MVVVVVVECLMCKGRQIGRQWECSRDMAWATLLSSRWMFEQSAECEYECEFVGGCSYCMLAWLMLFVLLQGCVRGRRAE